MSDGLVKPVTPLQAYKQMASPYTAKMRESDLERAKCEARQRRALDLYDAAMKRIWGGQSTVSVPAAQEAPAA